MMNHRSVNPLAAPTLGVTISSPEPTMAALMIRLGPRCDAVASHPRGGLAVCSMALHYRFPLPLEILLV
jgi:hypothetical protein